MMATVASLHVVAVGSWGAAVASAIAAARPDTSVSLAGHDLAAGQPAPTGPRHVVCSLLAAGAPMPGYSSVLDEAAFQHGVPWLPIVVEHPVLRVGPAVVPGLGACYGCWRRRLRQHAVAPDLEAALEQTYRQATPDRPGGHLPAAARLAATIALDTVDRLGGDAAAEAGRVRQMDLVTRKVSAGHAVGVHGCPRCGLGRDEADRTYVSLLAELAELAEWGEVRP